MTMMISGASFPIKLIATNRNINNINNNNLSFNNCNSINSFIDNDDQPTMTTQLTRVKLDQLQLGCFKYNKNFLTIVAVYHHDSHGDDDDDQKMIFNNDDVESFILANKITKNPIYSAKYIDIYFDNYCHLMYDNDNNVEKIMPFILKSLNETQNDTTKNKIKSDYAFNINDNVMIINNNVVNVIVKNTITNPFLFSNCKMIKKFIEKSGNFYINKNIKLDDVYNDDYHHSKRFHHNKQIKLKMVMTLSAANHYVATQQINCQKPNNDIANNNPTKLMIIVRKQKYNDEKLNNNRDDAYNNKCDDFLYLTNNNLSNNNNNTLKNVITMRNKNIKNLIIKNINHKCNNRNETQQKTNKMPKYIINPNCKTYKNNYDNDIKTPTNKKSLNYYITDHNRNVNLINNNNNNKNKYNGIDSLKFNSHIIDKKNQTIKDNNINTKYTDNLMRYPRGPATNFGWGIPRGAGLRGGGEEKNGNQANTWNSGGGNTTANWPNPNVAQQRNSSTDQKAVQSSQLSNQPSNSSGGVSGSGGNSAQNPNTQNSNSSNSQSNWNPNAQQQQQQQNPQQQQNQNAQEVVSNTQPAGPSGQANNGAGAANAAAVPPKIDAKLNSLRESLFSVDGWGGNFVNQSTVWDLPKSPQFSKRNNSTTNDGDEPAPAGDGQGGSQNSGSGSSKFNNFCWNKINNGTELWEANLRNGGPLKNNGTELWGAAGAAAGAGAASQEKQKKPAPYHPLTNLGGIWGENEFDHDMEMEFNNMEGTNQHQNTMNFGNDGNAEEDENIFARKKHRNVDAFDNYHHEFLGGGGNNAGAPPSVVSGGGSNVGGTSGVGGSGVGGGGGVGVNSATVNTGANESVIRGDPRGISGRLNGNPEIWNQNQQSFSNNQNSNFFNAQSNNQFPNKNQIFQNQQQNFMNFSQLDKGQGGIDFAANMNQPNNSQFNQASINPVQKRINAITGGGGNVGSGGGNGGGGGGGGNGAAGSGFNNFVDDLGTSIWGNFNAQNTPNINQNPGNVINQNFPIRNQNQINQKRGGNGSSGVGGGGIVGAGGGMIPNSGSLNWGDIDKGSSGLNSGGGGGGGGGGGWNKFGGNDKPSANPWPSATPPIPSAGGGNPNGANGSQLQNPNLQLSQAQNLLNNQKFDNPGDIDWKNPQKNFNLQGQELFHPAQLTQHSQKSLLPFPYPVKNNQNQRYINPGNSNELLFSSSGSSSAAAVTAAAAANKGVNKIDDFSSSCDAFSSNMPDDFLMYKNQTPFNQSNASAANLNYNFNQKLHFNQLNDFGAGGGNNSGGAPNSGNDSVDRIVRGNGVGGGNGIYQQHQQNNPQMPQSPPISIDSGNRMLLERSGMGNAGGLQSVGVQPPPNHSLHSQQNNQRGNFGGNFQQNQQNFGQNQMNNYSNQPTAAQLRLLVQQIQMAVHAGYLHSQILNQPLSPHTLVLLNQLLQQIKQLQMIQNNLSRLTLSASGAVNSNANTLQLSVQATKLKQSISNLQSQIASQQAIYMKQQQQSSNMSDMIGNFNEMNMKQENYTSSNQSRLNQWKLPSIDNNDVMNPNPIMNLGGGVGAGGGDNFSRAPGTISKATTSTATSNTNIGVGGIMQPDGTWSNQVRDGGGWPSVESESEANFTDLVPEFEPGKPWKGSQIKTIEDDPSLTPGSVARSPLSICPTTTKEGNELFSTNSSKNSPNQEFCLSSNTWSFNPSLSNSATMSAIQKQSSNATELWGASSIPSQSIGGGSGDISKGGSSRGPPPGLGVGKYRNMNNLSNFAGMWNGSSWLLLKNLTTQIDGSTLRTLCMQHGPLQNFHLYLNHGVALCKYSSREEAQKAQIALNNCVLGNTTICCESPHESEVPNILQHLKNSSNNNLANVPSPILPIVPVPWRPPNQQVSSSNSARSNDAWGASSVSSATWPTSTSSSTSNNSANIETNENSFLPENLLQSEI